jgi:hypothetical protein
MDSNQMVRRANSLIVTSLSCSHLVYSKYETYNWCQKGKWAADDMMMSSWSWKHFETTWEFFFTKNNTWTQHHVRLLIVLTGRTTLQNKIHIYTHTHLEVDRISTRQSYSIFFFKIIFYLGMTPKKIWSGAHHPQKGLAQEEAEWRRLRTPSPEPGPWRHHVGETGYTSNGMIPYGYLT